LSEPLKALIGNRGLNYQILDLLPIPIEIFAADGMCIFANRAILELHNIPDASIIVDKYNFNNDPVCLDIMGQDVYDRVSRGEAVSFPNFPAPIQNAVDRGYVDDKPYEAATMDLFFLPIWDGDVFTCTIMVYTIKNVYIGRADIVKAQEYIEEHWLDEFDLDVTARLVHLGKWQFERIFKEITSYTLYEYYQNIKRGKLQEKLLDDSLTIEQACSTCGVDYHGRYRNLFKEKTGMTPVEYRKATKK